MWHSLRRILAAPTFPDKELTRAARWLNFLLLILTTLLIGDTVAILLGLLDQGALATILLTNAIALTANLICLLLMRRGYVQVAAAIILTIVFALITYTNAVIFQSIRTPNVLTYFVLLPLTGLLLGRRGMNTLAAVCVVAISIIFYLEWTGILTPLPNARSILDDLVVVCITLALTTVLLNAAVRRVEEKTEEIQCTAAELATANQNLKVSQLQLHQAHAELEDRVQQRTEELRQSYAKLEVEIEERQHVLDALRKSEASWRSLATNVPEAIALIDLEGHITFVNRPVGGRSPETLLGAPATLLHQNLKNQELQQQSMAHVLRTGETTSYESETVTEERVAWYVNRVGAIQEDGEITALILISTDVTEQKQAEAAMFQAQKLESLGILAGGVAHDFNNLLTAMLLQMSFALAKVSADHAIVRHVQATIKAAEHATELTRQMLNYSGRSQSEIRPLDLNDLITDNLHLFSAAISKSIELTSVLSGSIPLMMGDRSQIQQLIMNLILNSADAIGQRAGTITVITEVHELTTEEVAYWQWTGAPLSPGRYVKLEVHDTGSGMDSKTLTKIFDPFFTTKFTGRGLGLASVLGIMRSHQGGLHVASTVGKGTTFTLLFPALVEALPLPDEAAAAPPALIGGGLVLVIDDEEMVRDAMAEILTAAGLQVLQAADGPTGIRLFRQHESELTLILLDLSMPGMSGEEVFYELRRHNTRIPVLLVSGYSEHEVMDRFVNKGLTGFIQKPFTTDSLLQQIQPHLQTNFRQVKKTPSTNGAH
jgi:PAS domain S-box-containing protein